MSTSSKTTLYTLEGNGRAEIIRNSIASGITGEEEFDQSVLDEHEVLTRYRITITVTELETK